MVIRILTGKDVSGAVRYNEEKVERQQAERIHIANYPDTNVAAKSARFRLALLEQYAWLNPGIRKPSVHIAVAFHPSEQLTQKRLREIGDDVMAGAGYGKQPYLMYQHHDTAHPHIHIVTVCVDAKGNRIDDSFLRNRLQQLRRRLEHAYNLVPAQDSVSGRQIDRVGEGGREEQNGSITLLARIRHAYEAYTFGSVDSFRQFLRTQGVKMTMQAGRTGHGVTFQAVDDDGLHSRPVRASAFDFKPTYDRLTARFAAHSPQHQEKRAIISALLGQQLKAYKSITEVGFQQALQQVGINFLKSGKTYLYVHSRAGVVVQEAELDKAYYRQVLMQMFGERTERIPVVRPKQMKGSMATTLTEPSTLVRSDMHPQVVATAETDATALSVKDHHRPQSVKPEVSGQSSHTVPIADTHDNRLRKKRKKNRLRH